MKPKTITIAQLRMELLNQLNTMDDNDEVYFGAGDLSLYRLKNRGATTGPKLLQIEFNEVYSVTVDPDEL